MFKKDLNHNSLIIHGYIEYIMTKFLIKFGKLFLCLVFLSLTVPENWVTTSEPKSSKIIIIRKDTLGTHMKSCESWGFLRTPLFDTIHPESFSPHQDLAPIPASTRTSCTGGLQNSSLAWPFTWQGLLSSPTLLVLDLPPNKQSTARPSRLEAKQQKQKAWQQMIKDA